MRLARDLGTVQELLPEGIDSLTDMPHTLFRAVRLGLTYLSFEELPEDETPPKRIWEDAEKLNEWFKDVKRKRDEKYGVDDKKAIENPVDNEAASLLMTG